MEVESYHFRQDVFAAVTEAIPLICRGRQDVITFFRGAGLSHQMLVDLAEAIRRDPNAGKKHHTTRELLRIANEDTTNAGLRIRRELIKRIVDFNNFEACWPNDILPAKGAVAKVRELVNEKDTFTRIAHERERERSSRIAEAGREATEKRRKAEERETVKREFYALYTMQDVHLRGKAFEKVLSKIFALDGMSVRESFTLRGNTGEGVIEQIDGVVKLDNDLYLVEAKWWSSNIGRNDVTNHMMRVANRGEMRGLYIAEPGFAPAAIALAREELQRKVFILGVINEIFGLFESGASISDWMREKVHAAMIEKDPHRILLRHLLSGG